MEDKEVGTLLHRVLDLHDEVIKQKEFELQKLAHNYADLNHKYMELRDNNKAQQLYTLEMITVAFNLSRESPGKKIQVIKAIRDRFGLFLKDAKDLVDAVSPPYSYNS